MIEEYKPKIGERILGWDKNENQLKVGDFLMTHSPKGEPVLFQLIPFAKDEIPRGCKIYEIQELDGNPLCLIRGDKKIIIPGYYVSALEKVTQDAYNAVHKEWKLNQLSPYRQKHLELKKLLSTNPSYSKLQKIKKEVGV
jgi:hypothetical protein